MVHTYNALVLVNFQYISMCMPTSTLWSVDGLCRSLSPIERLES